MALKLTPLDCGHIEGTERSAHQYLTGFGEKICSQSILWVVEGGPYPVVVDLPTSRPELVRERFGRTWVQAEAQRPRAAVAALGIDPDEVRAVVLSHLHWDHSIGIEDDPFPNADIYIQIEELRYAAAPFRRMPASIVRQCSRSCCRRGRATIPISRSSTATIAFFPAFACFTCRATPPGCRAWS